MNIITRIRIYLHSSVLLIINKKYSLAERVHLLIDFNRYSFKTLLVRYFNCNFKHESILGYKLYIDYYPDFVSQFVEIFVNFIYYFSIKVKYPKIIDCGSNIGISIIFFKIVYPQSKIISFEPDPNIFKLLSLNIQTNKLNNITLYNNALFSNNKILKFYDNSSTDPLSAKSIANSIYSQNHSKKFTFVKSLKLSKFINTNIDILKLDVEGAETKILYEIKNQIQKIRNIVLEFHTHSTYRDNKLSIILNVFENNKFYFSINDAPGQSKKIEELRYLIIKATKKTI